MTFGQSLHNALRGLIRTRKFFIFMPLSRLRATRCAGYMPGIYAWGVPADVMLLQYTTDWGPQ